MAYTETETTPDRQADMEPFHFSDDSSNEYHASDQGEKAGPDTEPDVQDLNSAGGTLSRRLWWSQKAERLGNKDIRRSKP